MTLGLNFSERSEREINNKEKAQRRAHKYALTNMKLSRSTLLCCQVFLLDTLKNVKFCP